MVTARTFDYQSYLPGMRILCNWMGLPQAVYARHFHQIHALRLIQSDLAITDNATAMVGALRVNWAWQIPYIYRAKYIESQMRLLQAPDNTDRYERIYGLEQKVLASAAHVLATTQEIADALSGRVAGVSEKLSIVPNFVETDLFRPLTSEDKRYDLVYVGRMSAEKNLDALLQAVQQTGVSIAMIGGQGNERTALQAKFGDLDGRIHWVGHVNNTALPSYLNRARALILCSLSEGHPRALIEGMACGLPVIGTKVSGIQNVIQHGETGYLCDTDARSIAAAIQTVLEQPLTMEKLGANARQFTIEKYSLQNIAGQIYECVLEAAVRNPLDSRVARGADYFRRKLSPSSW